MKIKVLSTIILSIFALHSYAQEQNPAQEYAKLKAELAVGWNTWNTRSVLSHVFLPDGLALNLELKDGQSGNVLKESLIGRRGENVETIRPGLHSYDGSYTELTIEWKGINLKIESAANGNDEAILITPINKNKLNQVIVRPEMLWGRKGKIVKTTDGFAADISSGNFKIYGNNFIKSVARKDSIFQEASLDKIVGISIDKKQTIDEIKATIAQARNKLLLTYKNYAKDEELYKPMQNVLAWDVIYEPTHDRVIAPVSRIWSVDAKGWVIFDWDTYFASWMFALDNKNLAYANAIAITNEITDSGFIPNYAAGLGKTNDRSQPPVGSIVIKEIYKKYKEKWLLEYVFDKLLSWNRWWPKKRDVGGYLVWGSDLVNKEAPKWESGMDNSTMYDSAPYDSISKLQKLADVGLMSTYIADCHALADIAKELNKPDVVAELNHRAEKYTKSLKTLWSEPFGLFLNKNLENGQFSYRLSPTLFYPMLAKVATPHQSQRMMDEHFYNPKEFWGKWILPSSPRNDTAYKDNTYWRGRIWAPLNFLVYLGIRNYNLPQARKDIVNKSKELLLKSWSSHRYIYENYNAENGEGDDVPNSDKFYHWGALLGFISIVEDGNMGNPLQPLNQK
ncbi:putative isomerase [Pedobacter sp. UYP30]|uniref:MGH1-like glycoside hydrolase domain-containing protein n=1 Tax=Pedobacter sp. UYP30 TaxID=1756400 RepID=UPI00339AA7EC